MARSDSSSLLPLLQAWIPDFVLQHFIDQSGWVQRERQIDPILFVWILILGWSADSERSIASLHRTCQLVFGCDCDRAAFCRFTPELVVQLSGWLEKALRHVKRLEDVGMLRWFRVLRERADVMPEEVACQRPGWRQVDKLELLITQLRDPHDSRTRRMLNPCLVDHFS